MYSVGDIQRINCSLDQNDHRIPHRLPGGSQPITALNASDALSVCPSVRLTDRPQTLLFSLALSPCLSLSLSPLSVWCCIHIRILPTEREGDGKVTVSSETCVGTRTWAKHSHTYKDAHSKICPPMTDICRLQRGVKTRVQASRSLWPTCWHKFILSVFNTALIALMSVFWFVHPFPPSLSQHDQHQRCI